MKNMIRVPSSSSSSSMSSPLPSPSSFVFCSLLVILVFVCQLNCSCCCCHALTPTAEIHIFMGGRSSGSRSSSNSNTNAGGGATTTTTTPLTLLATQALYGPLSPMRGFRQRHQDDEYEDDGPTSNKNNNNNNNKARLVLAPKDNPLLCNDNITMTKHTTTTTTTTTTNTPSSSSSSYSSILQKTKGSILVVPRGECTYEYKTYIAQSYYEAAGLIIYNTLASRYTLNKTKSSTPTPTTPYTVDDIIWPLQYHDYDCSYGHAVLPTTSSSTTLNFDHPLPYNSIQNDPLLSGDTNDNLCRMYDTNNLRDCPSKRCLVAKDDDNTYKNGEMTTMTTTTTAATTVCCAWDLHLLLWPDKDIESNVTITIPTVFITMAQGDQLLALMMEEQNSNNVVEAIIYTRWRPYYNVSSILIWVLGVSVAALAAFNSASDYHIGIHKLLVRNNNRRLRQQQRLRREQQSHQQQQQQSTSNSGLVQRTSSLQEEPLALEPIHAVGFVIMASSSLFILFFFKIYNVVKVMYAFGCSNALIQVITYPLISKLLSSRWCRKNGYPPNSPNSYIVRQRLLYRSNDFGDVTNWDVLAAIIGYSWGMTWLYMALFVLHPDQHMFYWLTQDVMGTCMCITFLSLIQLNSIQVASILLIVAFVYDIFFVFITPLLFKESVMITVATSGGPPKADALWCEKYPHDTNCTGGDPLPMLLTIPRLLDYAGGASLLGLGDIVLPGLLLSFAARLDAAKCLVGIASGGKGCDDDDTTTAVDGIVAVDTASDNDTAIVTDDTGGHNTNTTMMMMMMVPSGDDRKTHGGDGLMMLTSTNTTDQSSSSFFCCHGIGTTTTTSAWYSMLFGTGGYYFVPLVVSYAVGLAMANIAVYVMQMGQPALLYLVPCTLGTMSYLGWKRQELFSLWEGPRVIATADEIVYGRRPSQQQHQPTSSSESQQQQGDDAVGMVRIGSTESDTGGPNNNEEFADDDDETGDVPLLSSNTNNNNINNRSNTSISTNHHRLNSE